MIFQPLIEKASIIPKTCSNLGDKGKSNLQECESKIDVHAHTFEDQDHGGIFPFACNDASWLHYSPNVKGE